MSMHNGRNRIAHRRRTQKDHEPSGQPRAISATETKRKKQRKEAKGNGPCVSPALPGLILPLAQMPAAFTVSGTPCFPAGLVAPKQLGVVITSVAMPDIQRPKSTAGRSSSQRTRAEAIVPPPRRTVTQVASMPPFTPRRAPAMAAQIPAAPVPPDRPALTLPKQPEPLVVAGQTMAPETAHPDDRSPFFMPEIALPKNRALTQPSPGLVGAIGAWLHSFGQLIASGFLVKKTRPRPFSGPTPANRRMSSRHAAAQPTLREAAELTQLRAENRRLRGQLDALDALRKGKPAPQEDSADAT